MRRPCNFKRSDLIRAAKAIQELGLEIDSVEVNRDGLNLHVRKPGDARAPTESNEWHELLNGEDSASVR
jgi:hypothetical protein